MPGSDLDDIGNIKLKIVEICYKLNNNKDNITNVNVGKLVWT